MKSSEAAGLSGVVVNLLKASCETGIALVMELANSIVNDVVPANWEVSTIVYNWNEVTGVA